MVFMYIYWLSSVLLPVVLERHFVVSRLLACRQRLAHDFVPRRADSAGVPLKAATAYFPPGITAR